MSRDAMSTSVSGGKIGGAGSVSAGAAGGNSPLAARSVVGESVVVPPLGSGPVGVLSHAFVSGGGIGLAGGGSESGHSGYGTSVGGDLIHKKVAEHIEPGSGGLRCFSYRSKVYRGKADLLYSDASAPIVQVEGKMSRPEADLCLESVVAKFEDLAGRSLTDEQHDSFLDALWLDLAINSTSDKRLLTTSIGVVGLGVISMADIWNLLGGCEGARRFAAAMADEIVTATDFAYVRGMRSDASEAQQDVARVIQGKARSKGLIGHPEFITDVALYSRRATSAGLRDVLEKAKTESLDRARYGNTFRA